MYKIIKVSQRDMSIFASGFFAGCIATLFFVFACALFYGSSQANTNTPANQTVIPVKTSENTPTKASTAAPSRTPVSTRTPVAEECYLQYIIFNDVVSAYVYFSVSGEEPRLFCEISVANGVSYSDDGIISYFTKIESIPNHPSRCKVSTNNLVIEVFSEYSLFADAACASLLEE